MRHAQRIAVILSHVAKGAAIGAANIVPGVSGGTIAVVTGIYDRLVEAIGDFLSPRWRTHAMVVFPVLGGAIVGIASFAWVIELGLEHAREQTFFFFIGLIAGSLPFVAQQVRGHRVRPWHPILALAALGVLVAQAIIGESSMSSAITVVSGSTILPLLGAGVVATATMIIPGISGSFVLLLIGMYATFINAVRTANVPVLLVLAIGAAVGLIGASKLISRLLSRWHASTYWVILGLVAGSIVGIWPGITSMRDAAFDGIALLGGVVLALLLGKKPTEVAS